MNRRVNLPPLVLPVLFFILGILFAYFKPVNFLILSFLIFFLFLLIFIIKKEFWNLVLLFLLSFFLGALHFENKKLLPQNDISYYFPNRYMQACLKIKVISPVEEYLFRNRKKFVFLAKVYSLIEKDKTVPVSGNLRVYMFGERKNFEYGDVILCRGNLLKIKDKKVSLTVGSDKVKVIKKGHLLRYIFRLRKKLNEVINAYLPFPHQAILSALILGERRMIPQEIRENFIRTGTVHILAISGLHVGMVVYIVYLLLKFLRFSRQLSYFLLLLFIFLYAILTGAKPPVIRASIMSSVYLIGLILKREGNLLNSLALACWLILLFNPEQLFNIGFQLSFLVVLSIIVSLHFREDLLRKENSRIKKFFLKGFMVSLSAWLGSAGLIGYYFKMANPIAILANLWVVPLGFLILATGMMLLISPSFLAIYFANTNFLFIEVLLKSVKFLSKIPWGSILLPSFPFPGVVLYYLTILGLILLIKKKKFSS